VVAVHRRNSEYKGLSSVDSSFDSDVGSSSSHDNVQVSCALMLKSAGVKRCHVLTASESEESSQESDERSQLESSSRIGVSMHVWLAWLKGLPS
jgi:hypothetical protein